MTDSLPTIEWTEDGAERSALWRSEAGLPPPKRVVIADDQTPADTAYRLASEGTALLWRGDFQNARQLLQAMARRVDRKPQRKSRNAECASLGSAAWRRGASRGAGSTPGQRASSGQ